MKGLSLSSLSLSFGKEEVERRGREKRSKNNLFMSVHFLKGRKVVGECWQKGEGGDRGTTMGYKGECTRKRKGEGGASTKGGSSGLYKRMNAAVAAAVAACTADQILSPNPSSWPRAGTLQLKQKNSVRESPIPRSHALFSPEQVSHGIGDPKRQTRASFRQSQNPPHSSSSPA